MNEFYQSVNLVLYNLDSVVMLWIAVPLACLFVGILIYDSYRRERKIKKRASRGVAASYRNIRSAYRTLEQDANRRRRMERGRPRRF